MRELHVSALCEFESSNPVLNERPRIKPEVAHKDGHLENIGKLLLKNLLIMNEQLIELDAVFFGRCGSLGSEVDLPMSRSIVGCAAFEMCIHVLKYSDAVFMVESFMRYACEGWIECRMHCGKNTAEVVVETIGINIVSSLVVNSLISFSISMMVIVARNWLSPDAVANREQVYYIKDTVSCSPLDVAVFGLR